MRSLQVPGLRRFFPAVPTEAGSCVWALPASMRALARKDRHKTQQPPLARDKAPTHFG